LLIYAVAWFSSIDFVQAQKHWFEQRCSGTSIGFFRAMAEKVSKKDKGKKDKKDKKDLKAKNGAKDKKVSKKDKGKKDKKDTKDLKAHGRTL